MIDILIYLNYSDNFKICKCGINMCADLQCERSLAGVPGLVAGFKLLESWNVPDSSDCYYRENVDGAGEAADPVSGKKGVCEDSGLVVREEDLPALNVL